MRKGKKANRANFKLDSRLIKTALVFIFSLFLLSYLYKTAETFLSQSNTFLVNENCVKSNVVLDKNTKREISGKSLFSLDAGKIRRMLLEGNPLYQEVCVLKEFPATVKILIKKRRPLAQIKNSLFYLIDREGVILSGGSAEPFDNFVAIDLYDRARKLDPGDLIRDKRLEYAFILWEAFQGKDVVKRFVIN
jgi:cell division septal protein FtsQ